MNYSYNFDDKKRIKKKRIIFAVVFFIITILIASFLFRNNNNTIISKVSNVVISPFKFVYSVGSGITTNSKNYFSNLKKANDQNNELTQKVRDLEAKLLESQRIIDENKSLKEMLNIKTVFQHFNMKFAKIIAREHDNWTQTFVINIGSNDGIKVNQAVVHENGLVGYVSKVDASTSTVVTILDPIASVSVNISTINEPAILQGDLSLKAENKLKLTYVPIGAEISIGDMLYTSGLGSTYPNGIPVGKITEVVNKKNDIDRYAIVETSVNIRTISEVGIIIN